jgi:hypothetical protein
LGIKPEDTSQFAIGRAVHYYIQDVAMGRKISPRAHLQKMLKNSNAIQKEAKSIVKVLSDPTVQMVVNQYFGIAAHQSQIEHRVSFYTKGIPIPIVGFIDILTAKNVPIDIKTSTFDWSHDRVEEEIQPDFYLTALDRMGKFGHEGTFEYFIVVKDAKNPRCYVLNSTRKNYMERADYYINIMWKGYKSEMWKNVDPCPKCAQFGDMTNVTIT